MNVLNIVSKRKLVTKMKPVLALAYDFDGAREIDSLYA